MGRGELGRENGMTIDGNEEKKEKASVKERKSEKGRKRVSEEGKE